jgi:acid stress-induced BolA-like protein IbaG/YrbA
MTKEQAKAFIKPKLLSDDLIILGDGDKFDLIITERIVKENADLEIPKKVDQRGA